MCISSPGKSYWVCFQNISTIQLLIIYSTTSLMLPIWSQLSVLITTLPLAHSAPSTLPCLPFLKHISCAPNLGPCACGNLFLKLFYQPSTRVTSGLWSHVTFSLRLTLTALSKFYPAPLLMPNCHPWFSFFFLDYWKLDSIVGQVKIWEIWK